MLFWLSAALALPPVDINLGAPKLVSSLVQAGTGPTTGGVVVDRAQYTPYWEDVDAGRTYPELCLVAAPGSGSSSAAHRLELWYSGTDGLPAVQAYVSFDFAVSGAGLYCVDFGDASTGTLLDATLFDSNGDLWLLDGDLVWLVFERGSGLGSVTYELVNGGSAQRLGRIKPTSGSPGQGVLGLVETGAGGLAPASTGLAALFLATGS